MLRLPRRQVDTFHPDVRSLVLQFQLSLGATKRGAPMPRLPPRVPKKVLALPLPPPPTPPPTHSALHPTPNSPPPLLAEKAQGSAASLRTLLPSPARPPTLHTS